MMKFSKLLVLTLTMALILVGMTACQSDDGHTDANTGYCDMIEINKEIDSMRVGDFEETTNVTEYVKFTVKDYGTFVIRLRPDVAPITVDNFQQLVSKGFYNGLTFHRVIKDFVIQGGDPDGNGRGGSKNTIKGEFASNGVTNQLSHITGVISMARLGSDPNSATSQFFICNSNAAYSLDGSYAGFGYVVAGLETVYSISDAEVVINGSGEVSYPVTPVVIEKIVFVEKK